MSLDEIKRKRAEDEASRDKALEKTKTDLKQRNQKKIQDKLDKKKVTKKDKPSGKDMKATQKQGGKQVTKNFKK